MSPRPRKKKRLKVADKPARFYIYGENAKRAAIVQHAACEVFRVTPNSLKYSRRRKDSYARRAIAVILRRDVGLTLEQIALLTYRSHANVFLQLESHEEHMEKFPEFREGYLETRYLYYKETKRLAEELEKLGGLP